MKVIISMTVISIVSPINKTIFRTTDYLRSLTVLVCLRNFVGENGIPVTSSIDGLVLNSKLGEIPGNSIVRPRRT